MSSGKERLSNLLGSLAEALLSWEGKVPYSLPFEDRLSGNQANTEAATLRPKVTFLRASFNCPNENVLRTCTFLDFSFT